MNPRRVFTFSMLLNLALAGLAVWLVSRPRGGVASEERTAAPAAVLPPASTAAGADVANTLLAFTYVTNRFEWKVVESEDFESLAANLRVIGCPEKTVHDVVVARARRALAGLARNTGPTLPFWTTGLRRERATTEKERTAWAARAKIIAGVERVIGQGRFAEDSQMMDDYVGQAVMRFITGPMSEEKFSRVVVAFTRFEARRSEIDSRSQGVRLDADEAALADGRAQLHRELASTLTSLELEEFIARGAGMGLAEQILFEATDLTTAEVRQLALLRGQMREPFSEDFMFGGGSSSAEEREQFYTLARQRFGEARFAQIERAADDEFKTLFQISRENDLPRDAAEKAFELRKLTAQEVAHLREDKSLTDTERQQRLATMQTEAQEAVLKVLGTKASAQYLNQGGAWVTNMSGL